LKSLHPFIIHIPHASARIPFKDGYVADDRVIEDEIKKLTDWFTDDLFCFPEMENIEIVADFSRVFCDVERFENDDDEPMAKKGMGVLYASADDGRDLRHVTPELKNTILSAYYHPHHQRLTNAVTQQLETTGQAIIIDAHSFSSTPFIRDDDQTSNRPDFCIGTDPFHTPEEWIGLFEDYFRGKGHSLAINSPYAGTIVPLCYYGKDARVKSIMLEVNRKLYMDENTHEKLASFAKMQETIRGFVHLLNK